MHYSKVEEITCFDPLETCLMGVLSSGFDRHSLKPPGHPGNPQNVEATPRSFDLSILDFSGSPSVQKKFSGCQNCFNLFNPLFAPEIHAIK